MEVYPEEEEAKDSKHSIATSLNGSYVARASDALDARASSVSDVPRIGIRVVRRVFA